MDNGSDFFGSASFGGSFSNWRFDSPAQDFPLMPFTYIAIVTGNTNFLLMF